MRPSEVAVNLAFFLTPVADVVWLPSSARVGEAVDSLRHHGYSSVPVLDPQRRYVSAVTARDLLSHLALPEGDVSDRLDRVTRRAHTRAVGIETDIRGLLAVAADQNFVPVVDSRGVMMGIVTRRAILTFCERLLAEHGLLPPTPPGPGGDKL